MNSFFSIFVNAAVSHPSLTTVLFFGALVCLSVSSSRFRSILWSTFDWRVIRNYHRFIILVQFLLGLSAVGDILAFVVSPLDGYLLVYAVICAVMVFVLRPSKDLSIRLVDLRIQSETSALVG